MSNIFTLLNVILNVIFYITESFFSSLVSCNYIVGDLSWKYSKLCKSWDIVVELITCEAGYSLRLIKKKVFQGFKRLKLHVWRHILCLPPMCSKNRHVSG